MLNSEKKEVRLSKKHINDLRLSNLTIPEQDCIHLCYPGS